MKKAFKEMLLYKYGTGFSSVGRAFDCSSKGVIKMSLVRFRQTGNFNKYYYLNTY